MFSKLKSNWLYIAVKTSWIHHTQPIRDVSQFINSRPGLLFCRLVTEGVLFSEAIIAFKHYRMVGWTEPEGYYQFDAKKYGLLSFVPGDKFSGQYTPAPFWRKEVGTIRCNYSPDPTNEFIVAHEAGHSLHPWRFLLTISYLSGALPVRFAGILSGPIMIVATYWCFVAMSERLADLNALQYCRKEALEATARWFNQLSLQNPRLGFPPDAHASIGQRYFLIERRIRQLESNPNIKSPDLPLEMPELDLFGYVIRSGQLSRPVQK
jgi:hypothetical protein